MKNQPKLRDRVLLIDGPDIGKTGVLLDIVTDDPLLPMDAWTIVKLDRNGNDYNEIKNVKKKDDSYAF